MEEMEISFDFQSQVSSEREKSAAASSAVAFSSAVNNEQPGENPGNSSYTLGGSSSNPGEFHPFNLQKEIGD